MKCLRGTLHIAVDTNFKFHRKFSGCYKSVNFIYHLGQKNATDCISACIKNSAEETYTLLTELLSVFSFSKEKAFNPVFSISDNFRGDLAKRKPGAGRARMLNFSIGSADLAGDLGIVAFCPSILSLEQSNLVRLYRKAITAEYFDDISSFLYYYHIIDYPIAGALNQASTYIDEFIKESKKPYILELVEKINNSRIFDKAKLKNITLGVYVRLKVRNSIAHIVREERYNAQDLKIDAFNQQGHISDINLLLKNIARIKLLEDHGFEEQVPREIFIIDFEE